MLGAALLAGVAALSMGRVRQREPSPAPLAPCGALDSDAVRSRPCARARPARRLAPARWRRRRRWPGARRWRLTRGRAAPDGRAVRAGRLCAAHRAACTAGAGGRGAARRPRMSALPGQPPPATSSRGVGGPVDGVSRPGRAGAASRTGSTRVRRRVRAAHPPLGLLVFVVGAASLGAEIAAARLLAPYFGASTIIWANTIATVLVALSAGLLARRPAGRPRPAHLAPVRDRAGGGRAAGRRAVRRPPFLRARRRARSARISVGGFLGSLLGVLALVAVPGAAAGHGGAVRHPPVGRGSDDAGRVSGRLYAISTAGSLFGTFLAALVLIPFAGHAAHVPGLRAGAGPGGGARPAPALAGSSAALLAVLIALPPGSINAAVAQRLAGHLRDRDAIPVRARRGSVPGGERWLQLNEGVAVHSVYRAGQLPDRRLLGRLPRAAVRGSPGAARVGWRSSATPPAPPRARSGHYFPATQIDAVEIDGAADGDRPALLRPGAGRAAAHVHRRRATVAGQRAAALRRDLRRRLPPALHPLLPDHARVLRARARAPEPGRDRGGQRRPPAGLQVAGARDLGDDARGASVRGCATRTSRPTRCVAASRRRSRRRGCAPRRPRWRPTCGPRPGRPRRGWRRR